MNTRLLLGCAFGWIVIPSAQAALVPFSSAMGTFDQGGSFTIGSTLDGTPVDTNSGWGVFGGQTGNQSAMWTAASPTSTTGGFIITLPQNYFADSHHLQRFRLALTTDAAPSLAGGNWTPLTPSALLGSGGVTFTDLGSDIIAATGGNMVTYQAAVSGNYTGVTGFRLEVFPETNGNNQLGAASNGNFVLSQFRVDTPEAFNWALLKQVAASGPVWFNQSGGGVNYSNLLTDDSLLTLNHPAAPTTPGSFSYTIDLGGVVDLTSVEIYGRADGCCPERLTNYQVDVLDVFGASVWQGTFHTDGSNPGVGGFDLITEGQGVGTFEGRSIRITNLAGGDYNPQVAEVKAFGALVPEPATALLALAAGGAMLLRRRR